MTPKEIDSTLAAMFQQAELQFGDAIKGYWFYEPDPCPGCGGEIDAVYYKGRRNMSLNAFIYRKRGVLIGYFLCSKCALQLFQAAEINPGKQIPLHGKIEETLIRGYLKHLQ